MRLVLAQETPLSPDNESGASTNYPKGCLDIFDILQEMTACTAEDIHLYQNYILQVWILGAIVKGQITKRKISGQSTIFAVGLNL